MGKKKVIFLYYELMGYTLAGLKALLRTDPDFDLYVISHDKEVLTPYIFEALPGMNYRKISEFPNTEALLAYCRNIQPDLLFVNSWRAGGSEYMTVSRYFTSIGVPTICMFDNQWMGTLKQWIAVWTAPFFIRKHFSYMWGCADRQAEFASRMGYPNEKIFRGFYTCDADLYGSLPVDRVRRERNVLFVGRFAREKGINLLIEAFNEIRTDFPDWKLVLVGSGSPDLIEEGRNEQIRIEAFKQPEALLKMFEEASVFCLPSIFEPWGVVIHEAAMAALPIVCSDACGAGDEFVREDVSGYRFSKGNREGLKAALFNIMTLGDGERLNMGVASRELASRNTPEKWAGIFRDIIRVTTK